VSPLVGASRSQRQVLHAFTEKIFWLIGVDEHPSGVVYGLIIVGSVVAAESVHPGDSWSDIFAAIVVLFIYWMAHSYAEVMGKRLESPDRIGVEQIKAVLGKEWAIMRGAVIPVLVMAIFAIFGAHSIRVDEAGIIAAVVTLVLFTMLAGFRAHLRPIAIVAQAIVGLVFGVAIALMRAVLA